MIENYSVLMSVYYKERPEYLKESIMSIFNQTVPTDDFILICDGPLNEKLDDVIAEMEQLNCGRFHVYRLKKNKGLGYALNEGLKHCKNELVARMDSDDISRPERCERQLRVFQRNPDVSFSSGTVAEFDRSPMETTGVRVLPLTYSEIIDYSKKRNPMNHPCVMFKKSAVISVGGYQETFHLFEDYYLWVRMLMKGYRAINLEDTLLDMRTPEDIYRRRGGKDYAANMLRFHLWMKKRRWSSLLDFLTGAIPHAIVCIIPIGIRKYIYKMLRK